MRLQPQLLLLLLLIATIASQAPTLPYGTWTALPDLPVSYGQPNLAYTITNATLVVAMPTGNSFALYLSLSNYKNQPGTAKMTGSAVCADGAAANILISIDYSSCSASDQSAFPNFCDAAPIKFSGVLPFGYSSSGSVLVIDNWGGADWPFIFRCTTGPCAGSSSCNVSSTVTTNVYSTGGSLNVTDSNVQTINSTNLFTGDQITLADNNGITLNTNNTNQTIKVDGTENVFNFPAQPQQVTINQYCAKDCNSWMAYGNTLPLDQTVTSVAYEPLILGLSPELSLSDDATLPYWEAAGPLITYTGLTPATFTLSVCIQAGAVANLTAQQSYALLATIWNVTSNSILDAGTWAQSALVSNSTSTSYELNSVCSSTVVQHLKPLSAFLLYAKAADPSALPEVDIFTVKRGALFTFSAVPNGCAGCSLSTNITVINNGSTLLPRNYIAFTPSNVNGSEPYYVDNTGLWTLAAPVGGLARTGHAVLADSDHINFIETSHDDATNTTTWQAVLVGTIANLTEECGVSCEAGPNGTQVLKINGSIDVLNNVTAEHVCSKDTQCQVSSDPPSSSSPSGTALFPCLFCSGGGSGGGGDGGGGGVPPPFFIPFGFVPFVIVPFIVPLTGGPGNVGDPITQNGGLKVPIVNFTAPNPPICDYNSTEGPDGAWFVKDNSSLAERLYYCGRLTNGTDAWIPICGCQNSQSNFTAYYFDTAQLYYNTTIGGDALSQLIWLGSTYFGGTTVFNGTNTFVTPITAQDNITACGAGKSISATEFSGCSGAPAPFPNGISVTGGSGDTFTIDVIFSKHLQSSQGSAGIVVTAGIGLGTGTVGLFSTGNDNSDTAMAIKVQNLPGDSTGGVLFTVTYGTAFAKNPIINYSFRDCSAMSANWIGVTSGAGFEIITASGLTSNCAIVMYIISIGNT